MSTVDSAISSRSLNGGHGRIECFLTQEFARFPVVFFRSGLWEFSANVQCHLGRKIAIDMTQTKDHLINDLRLFDFVEFEGESANNVVLLVTGQGVIEELRLVVVLLELWRAKTLFHSSNLLWVSGRDW